MSVRPSTRTVWFLAYLLLTVFAMRRAVADLVEYSLDSGNAAASQIVLVPFVTVALIWLSRKTIFGQVRYDALPGAAVAGLGLVALVGKGFVGSTGEVPDRLALDAAALVFFWIGGFIVFYGWPAFRSGLFPLAFLVFCIPIPTALLDRTIAVLQWASAEMAYGLLRITGTPVYREGFIFYMPGLVIEVAPECSGIRSGIGMFMTSLLAGHLFLISRWRRTILVLAAIPLLIFKNALRIDVLSLLTLHVDPGIMGSRLHHEGGVLFFALGLLLLYPVLVALVKSEAQEGSFLSPTGWPKAIGKRHIHDQLTQ